MASERKNNTPLDVFSFGMNCSMILTYVSNKWL